MERRHPIRIFAVHAVVTAVLLASISQPIRAAEPVAVRSVTASSTLEPEKKKYRPGFILDGNLETSWVEGATDDGIGQRITIELADNVTIEKIEIRNGFGKKKYWAKNNRVKELRVSSVQGQQSFSAPLADTFDPQWIPFPEGWRSNVVTLEIRSVYRGTTWRDTAIAEIRIPGVGTYDTREAKAGDLIGTWEHEGERTTYEFSDGGGCFITSRDYDPEMDETVESGQACYYDQKGARVTLHIRAEGSADREMKLVLKKEGALYRLWTENGDFIAQKVDE